MKKTICLIGAGRIARVHATAISATPDARIGAVVDPSRDAGEGLAGRLGSQWFETLDEAHSALSFDGVIIAAPTSFHASLIETCVARNLPTFCEKPVDLSLARIDACIARIGRSRAPVLIGFHRRFDAARREVRDLTKSGALGKIEHVLQISRDPRLPDESFIAHSGGMVRDMLIHDLDELTWLCGVGAVRVQADLRCLVDADMLQRYDDADSAAVMVSFQDGPQCQIVASRRAAYGFDQRLEVFGSRGLAVCPNTPESPIVRGDSVGLHASRLLDNFPQRYALAYAAEMAHFMEVIDGRAQPQCTVADARASMALAELVLESAKTGMTASADHL